MAAGCAKEKEKEDPDGASHIRSIKTISKDINLNYGHTTWNGRVVLVLVRILKSISKGVLKQEVQQNWDAMRCVCQVFSHNYRQFQTFRRQSCLLPYLASLFSAPNLTSLEST